MTRFLRTFFSIAISKLVLILISISSISTHTSYAQVNWDKVYGGTSYDEANKIIPAHDGGYLIGGTSESASGAEKTATNKSGKDFWIVKVDSVGTKLWDKSFSGINGDDNLTSLIATSDGGYLLGGISNSEVGFDKSDNHDAGLDYWVIKVDVQGNKIWDKNIGGNSDDKLLSMVETTDGGFLLAGHSDVNLDGLMYDKTEAGRGSKDYWVVKLDANGNKQ